MAVRIKVGNYIFDADGNTSSTTGVTLYPDSRQSLDASPEFFIAEMAATTARIGFWARVNASTAADLDTRTAAVVEAIQNPFGDIIVESDDDVTAFSIKVSDGSYSEISGTAEIHLGELNNLVMCVLEAVRTGTSGRGASPAHGPEADDESATDAEIDGLAGRVEVSGERNVAGRLAMTLEAKFRDRADLSLTISSVENSTGNARFVFSGSPVIPPFSKNMRLTVSGTGEATYNTTHDVTAIDPDNFKITCDVAFVSDETGSAVLEGRPAEDMALSFVDMIKDRTAPSNEWGWLGGATEMRVVGDVQPFTPATRDADGNLTQGGEATARVMLRQTPEGLEDLDARIVDVQAAIDITPRTIDERADSGNPGSDVIIAGVFQATVEGQLNWDSLNPKPTDMTRAEIDAEVDKVKTFLLSRADITATPTVVRRKVGHQAEDGTISWSVELYTAGGEVRAWDEETTPRRVSTKEFLRDTKGKEWEFPQADPYVQTVEHRLRVVRYDTPPSYKHPIGVGSGYEVVEEVGGVPKTELIQGSSRKVYTTSWFKLYRKGGGSTGEGGGKISLGQKYRIPKGSD